ncbi:unnamed protein product [Diamesa tonsa]
MKQPKNLGLLVCLTILLNIEPAFGMFDPTVRAVEMYFKNDTSFIDASGLKVRKVNRTQHVISGPFYVNVPIGNEYTYITYSYKKGGNEFKKLPYKFGPLPFCQYVDEEKLFFEAIRAASDLPPKGTCPWPKCVTYSFKKSGNEFKKLPYKVGPLPFCKYMDEEKFFVDTLRATSDIPARGTCPWPKKRYTVNNFFLNLDNIPPVFSTGEYRLDSEFLLNGKLQNGIMEDLGQISDIPDKKGGNEFKKLPYKFGPLPFCQYVDEEKLFFEAIRVASDLPPKGTCPWPKLVSSSVEIHLTFGKPYYPNDTKFFDLNKVRVKKINRTHHVIDGEMEFFRSFGDEYDVEVTFYQKSGIEYKKMPYKIGPKKFCSFFREEKTVYPDLQKHTDLPPIDTCPWPKVSILVIDLFQN